MEVQNPITSTGYYFNDGLDIRPGDNPVDVNNITQEQAINILKGNAVNHIATDDLEIIKKI